MGTTTFRIPKQMAVGTATAQIAEADCGSSSDEVLSLSFNPAHTKIAITLDLDTGASHVGYIDAGGNLVDVTALASPNGFSNLPHETNPVFDVSGTQLWFIDNHRFVHRDITTGVVTDAGKAADKTFDRTFLIGDPQRPVSGVNGIPDPDGTAIAWTDGEGTALQVWHLGPGPDPDGTGTVDTYWHSSNGPNQEVDSGIETAGDKIIRNCMPLGWTGPHTVLCDDSNLDVSWRNFYLADIGTLPSGPPNNEASVSLTALLPQTNRQISHPLLSPDGRTLYFVSAQQAFRVDTARPGVEPTPEPGPVLSLLTSGQLIWQI
jgi:hypothetical protein